MTVRHRQRKGAKSGFFLYAREKAFSKPQLFPPKPPEDSLKVPNNPTHPASFLRQFSPQHSPVARLFRGKKGLFCPQRPPYPPFGPPERPVLPPAPPVFCLVRARMETRLAPVLPGAPVPAHTPWNPGSPRVCGFFARPRPLLPAVHRPNARRLPRPPPKPPRRAPPARPLPPPAARRSARRPAEAQPWGWQPRLSRSAFPLRREEVCAPRGGSDPWA